jgi:hypothetical protein
MVRRLTVALQVIPGDALKLRDGLSGTVVQGAGNGRLLSTARAPKGPLHGGIDAHRHVTLGHGLGATQDPQQSTEHFVNRTIADRFLWNLHLCP